MNRYEYEERVKEGIRNIQNQHYDTAVAIFDSLDLEPIKDARELQTIAKAYEIIGRYDDAAEILLQAHKLAPKSRGTLFHLCNVCIKQGDLPRAVSYQREFEELFRKNDSEDYDAYILKYRIARKEGKDPEELVKILESLKDAEPDDRWMYKLALLYEKTNRSVEALQVCDEILLWFYNGPYVAKTESLRARLTGEAQKEESTDADLDDFEDETGTETESEAELKTESPAEFSDEFFMDDSEDEKPADVIPENEEFGDFLDEISESANPEPTEEVKSEDDGALKFAAELDQAFEEAKQKKEEDKQNEEVNLKELFADSVLPRPDIWHMAVSAEKEKTAEELAKKQIHQVSQSFPGQFDRMVRVTPDKLKSVDLRQIREYFKRLQVIIAEPGQFTDGELDALAEGISESGTNYLVALVGREEEIIDVLSRSARLRKEISKIFKAKESVNAETPAEPEAPEEVIIPAEPEAPENFDLTEESEPIDADLTLPEDEKKTVGDVLLDVGLKKEEPDKSDVRLDVSEAESEKPSKEPIPENYVLDIPDEEKTDEDDVIFDFSGVTEEKPEIDVSLTIDEPEEKPEEEEEPSAEPKQIMISDLERQDDLDLFFAGKGKEKTAEKEEKGAEEPIRLADKLLRILEGELKEQDAKLTEGSEEAIQDYIQYLIANQIENPEREMLSYTKNAIEKAEKGGPFGLFAGRIDEEGFLYVDRRHFEKAVKK